MNKSNQQLIDEILKLMPLSSMEADEQATWTILAPSLSEIELKKLHDTLQEEVSAMTDIYLNITKKQKTSPQSE
jgi:hypothetical protein